MLLNQFFIKEDFCFNSMKLVGSVLLDRNYSVFRHCGIKLYSLEKHARSTVNLCAQTLYMYDFSLFFVLEDLLFSSASLFVLTVLSTNPRKSKQKTSRKQRKGNKRTKR